MPPSVKHTAEEILMFVRYPEPGRAKTGLTHVLGPERAVNLARGMAMAVARVVRSLDRPGLRRVACFQPASREEEISRWLGDDFLTVAQPEGDLGLRLKGGIFNAFRNGVRRVVAIDTECVGITTGILGEAFDALETVDAVVGPGMDGTYYLIGLSRPCRAVFRGIPWRTDRMLRVTLARLRGCGLQVRLLPPLHGIDTPEGLLSDSSGLP